jgi:arginase
MRFHLFVLPYDSSRRDWRMGRGPLRVVAAAEDALRAAHHEVAITTLEASEPRLEVRTAFELCSRLAEVAREAVDAGELPVVLSGNCSATVGLLAALTPRRRGVVWLDAHGDFNTPETTPTGYLDGMALAIAAGRCWTTVAELVPGHAAIADEDVVLVGARDLDPGEREALSRSRVAHLGVADVRAGGLAAALSPLAARVEAAVLHVDVDVHDPERTPANCYPAPDGLFPEEVQEIARQVAAGLPLAGVTLASFDPDVDKSGATFAAVRDLVAVLGNAAAARMG